ncbi:TatD family hydrolase [Buchnera aphidicola]|uniref:TatD family hydrolase n=1 Tax=Buchnera aphidicola TaxID=9 RepID=UPI003464DE5A
MFLIDSHCHLHNLKFRNIKHGIKDTIEKAQKNNVKMILVVSTSIKDYFFSKKHIGEQPNILYSCGIHPNNIKNSKNNIKKLENIVINEKIIAIGETGLDYFYHKNNHFEQKLLFRQHIKIAKKFKKPLIIHCRKAIHDIFEILEEENSQPCKGVLHSFTENYNSAKKLIDLGFYISFSGIITFKNSFLLREIAKIIPIEKILIETDSPYLSPEPYRGKENQPAYLYEIAKLLAKLKNIDIETFSKQIKKNFFKLFNLPNEK